MTRASEELGLTQAAISKQIKSLEQNLGTRLFERRNRAVHLMDHGREFGRVVSEALNSVAVASRDLRQQHESGEVVLRSQLCEGLYWLMPRLSGFYQKYPDIPVRVTVSTKPLAESEERFDLALQTSGRQQGDTKQIFTASDEVFPVCSPAYLDGETLPLSMDRLNGLHLLHHKVEPQDWVSWEAWLARQGIDLQIGTDGTVFDSYPMMIQAMLEGHGVALAWRRTIDSYLNAGTVVRPFEERLCLPDGLSIYQPTGWQVRHGTSELLEWLKLELS
ncbi:LysR substrate-binding domain-containing protein [Anderseniella sp. Alg231-50]|uniref:LysR substrate-binding domain-containing protein n=1 Tax=Anderseniella sp. Alg231-50 TaxID=1922226 RepID=UPI003FCC4C23